MKQSRLSHMIDPLREKLYQYDMSIRRLKNSPVKTAGIVCDFLPVEVLAAFDIIPLRLPSLLQQRCCHGNENEIDHPNDLYDFIIVSGRCANKEKYKKICPATYEFQTTSGHGEDASVNIHNALDLLLKETGTGAIKNIDIQKLRQAAKIYNTIRRLVRGISTVRKQKPDLLSNNDLFTIFKSFCLPPDEVMECLAGTLDAMNRTESRHEKTRAASLLYSCIIDEPALLDEIEETGCIIHEDDSCNGRRQFDISLDTESPYLYYELLDAYSYRPYCPSLREPEERFELLYKLIGNHGIDLVLFLDGGCPSRKKAVEYTRIKLMRMGIDPLVIHGNNTFEQVEEYLRKREQ